MKLTEPKPEAFGNVLGIQIILEHKRGGAGGWIAPQLDKLGGQGREGSRAQVSFPPNSPNPWSTLHNSPRTRIHVAAMYAKT